MFYELTIFLEKCLPGLKVGVKIPVGWVSPDKSLTFLKFFCGSMSVYSCSCHDGGLFYHSLFQLCCTSFILC